jgi:hypothetical protein
MFGSKTPVRSGSVENGASHILATWGIVGFIAVACVVLIGLEATRILSQRSDVLADSQKDTANLAASLIQHAELTFGTADAILIGVVDRLEQEPLAPQSRERLRAWLIQEVRHSSQFVSFAVIDSDGVMIVGSAVEKEPGNFSDREHFIYHRTHDDAGLHIGVPIWARTVNDWIIPVTRRFNRADGSFGGVAVAAINPKYFQDIYDRLELGRNSSVLLVSLDGRVLVRRPFVESNVGRDMTQGSLFSRLKKNPVGSMDVTSVTDGIRRLSSYEQGHAYPLVVAVAQDMAELLAPWKQRAMIRLSEIVAITAFIMLMGAFVWRATRTLATNSITLRKTNDRFDAALANMSNGLSMFDGLE